VIHAHGHNGSNQKSTGVGASCGNVASYGCSSVIGEISPPTTRPPPH
jgi:hypothetical protein